MSALYSLETQSHRISRATRTANVMGVESFSESRGGRRTTLSPIMLKELDEPYYALNATSNPTDSEVMKYNKAQLSSLATAFKLTSIDKLSSDELKIKLLRICGTVKSIDQDLKGVFTVNGFNPQSFVKPAQDAQE